MSIGALIEKFREVALDRIEAMNLALLTLERHGDDEQATDDLLREVHTLKGEAKMLGFADVNLVAHQIESMLIEGAEYQFDVPRPVINVVFEGFDIIRMLLTKQIGSADNTIDLTGFIERVQLALEGLEQLEKPVDDTDYPRIPKDPFEHLSETQQLREISSPGVQETTTHNAGLLRLQTETSIRVRFDKLERLGDISSEVFLMNRRLTYQHKRLQQTHDDIKYWIEDNGQNLPKSQLALLQGMIHKLEFITTGARDENHLAQLRLSQMDEEVRGLRHISLAQVTGHYPRAVRDLAQAQGKQVRFIQEIGTIEVDRTILSALSDPLLHLIRNAVDHGIESPQVRSSQGKNKEAAITLRVTQQGDTLCVTLEDDGQGIDPERIKQKAIERGVLTQEQSAQLSHQEALSLIFRPGFSTRDEISDVSGRGLGMDIVRRHITHMGGVVELQSDVGQGTIFTLYLPLPSAISSVLLVRIGQQTYAFQSQEIERVVHRLPRQMINLHGTQCIKDEGVIVPVYDWRKTLEVDPFMGEPMQQFLIVQKGAKRIAISVDEVIGDHEAMIRPLSEFLQGIKMCRGVALTNTDELIPLLNILELMSITSKHHTTLLTTQTQRPNWSTLELGAVKRQKTILLAEDSEVTRTMIAKILSTLGYRILEAEDGKIAWRMLQEHQVDLLITDMQMPNMNGLQLLKHLRGDSNINDIPAIVLSTLGSAQDKAQAMQRGADMYLVKLDFREKELISAVQRYLKNA